MRFPNPFDIVCIVLELTVFLEVWRVRLSFQDGSALSAVSCTWQWHNTPLVLLLPLPRRKNILISHSVVKFHSIWPSLERKGISGSFGHSLTAKEQNGNPTFFRGGRTFLDTTLRCELGRRQQHHPKSSFDENTWTTHAVKKMERWTSTFSPKKSLPHSEKRAVLYLYSKCESSFGRMLWYIWDEYKHGTKSATPIRMMTSLRKRIVTFH